MTCNATAEHLACQACSLSNCRTQVVPGHGNLDATIALVGEAAGAVEDREGKPFVGPAGKVLDRLLTEAGIDPTVVWKTNVVCCHPPENAIKEYPDALVKCPELWLHPELQSLGYLKVIVALGATAGMLWFPGIRVGEMATLARVLSNGKIVVGATHPAYVLRGGGQEAKDSIKASLRRAYMYSMIKSCQ